jgi:DNA-binding NarL/FixJ family response regulator
MDLSFHSYADLCGVSSDSCAPFSRSALPTVPHLPATPTVLVIDDHELFRMGLRAVLSGSSAGPIALLEAECLQSGVRIYGERREAIQLVVLDLNLPDSRGLSALETFRRVHPNARIVAMSESFDSSVAIEARALGAEEVLHKASGMDVFRQIIGFAACKSATPAGHPAHPVVAPPAAGAVVSKQFRLTPRQVQILDLVLQGSSNHDIGAATGLKVGTVKNYISWLLVVFGVESRSRLISLFG